MSFLDDFFDKVGNEIEWGTKRITTEPGKVAVDFVDAALGQDQQLNPIAWLGNSIRSGIGSAGLQNEGVGILKRKRDSEGNIVSNGWDYFLKQDTGKLNAAGLKAAKGAKEYKVIGNEGFSYIDPDTKTVRTVEELDSAATILQNPKTQAALLENAKIDPFKDSLTKITAAGQRAGTENKASALNISTENLSSDPRVRQHQLTTAIGDKEYEKEQERIENSYRERVRKKERKEDLIRDMESEASRLNLDLATLAAKTRQADLDREYLDNRDMREYEYKSQKDDMARMDRVFELILGISKGL